MHHVLLFHENGLFYPRGLILKKLLVRMILFIVKIISGRECCTIKCRKSDTNMERASQMMCLAFSNILHPPRTLEDRLSVI